MFPQIVIGNVLAIIIGIFIIFLVAFTFVKNEIGKSRVEMLRQISDLNQFSMNAMDNTMEILYENIQGYIDENSLEDFDAKKANEVMSEPAEVFSAMGADFVIDIVMNKGDVYTSDDNKSRVEVLKATAWYTQLLDGLKTRYWYMMFMDDEEADEKMLLSLGQRIYDEKGETAGIAVISIYQNALFQSFENARREDNVIYIVDENGMVISHSNVKVVGYSFFYASAFEKKIGGHNSYILTMKNGRAVLLSNYLNAKNNWTFVEELDFSSKLKEYSGIVAIAILGLLAFMSVILVLDYLLIKRITNSLTEFSLQIKKIRLNVEADLSEIPIQDDYEEIYIITEQFNKTLKRIEQLIHDIKINEHQKRKAEFDFLQAQIDPHFLRNTLVTVKSLIALGEYEKAISTLNDFNALLKIPMMDKQFVTIAEEIELVMHYMAIMEHRFDKQFLLHVEMNTEMKHILIPRMILQPVVGNAVFHGLAGKEGDAVITILANSWGRDLIITITDNGEGMSQQQIDKIMSGKRNANSHHGVGLYNVRNRLRLIYGEQAGIQIRSKENAGTEVKLIFSDYQAIYRKTEEKEYENTNC